MAVAPDIDSLGRNLDAGNPDLPGGFPLLGRQCPDEPPAIEGLVLHVLLCFRLPLERNVRLDRRLDLLTRQAHERGLHCDDRRRRPADANRLDVRSEQLRGRRDLLHRRPQETESAKHYDEQSDTYHAGLTHPSNPQQQRRFRPVGRHTLYPQDNRHGCDSMSDPRIVFFRVRGRHTLP